jgi:hypothetical protein
MGVSTASVASFINTATHRIAEVPGAQGARSEDTNYIGKPHNTGGRDASAIECHRINE